MCFQAVVVRAPLKAESEKKICVQVVYAESEPGSEMLGAVGIFNWFYKHIFSAVDYLSLRAIKSLKLVS